MTGLSILLFGPFEVILDGRPASGFESNKVKALLAYLAAESERPHAREALAGLLWPDYPHRSALNNLRTALANLRRTIGDQQAQPPFLLITRDTLQFNAASNHWLDIAGLQKLSASSIEQLEEAAAVYRGAFLEGFSIEDSFPFEEWILYKRELLGRQMLEALQRLVFHYEAYGDYQRVVDLTSQALELEPWHEEAHRQLLRALTFSGRRSYALSQHESFSRLLLRELGAAPEQQTSELVELIRTDRLRPAPVKIDAAPDQAPPAPGDPPFKGLTFFDEADANLFFGRENLTTQLVEQVRRCLDAPAGEKRLVTVIGASGSGKSSAVRAGLVPNLKRQELSFQGQIQVMTPTARPLEALAVCLTDTADSLKETSALLDNLAGDSRTLHLFATRLAHLNNGRCLLLVVDQFEELFSMCSDEAERKAFIDNLLYAVSTPGSAVVLVALRADFYVQCAPYAELRQALCVRQQYIGAMSEEEVRRAIGEPARQGSWLLEPGLVDLLLRDLGDEPGALPLLSHALLETWRRRRGRTLTLAAYQETGGVQGAIAQTAEDVYEKLTPEQQVIARKIFLRLTELTRSGDSETQPALYTRRRVKLADIIRSETENAEIKTVLNKLADARLVTVSQETAEVAHEALIRAWARLGIWLDESREALRLHRQLSAAAREWEKLDYDSGALYRGAQLSRAVEWFSQNPGELTTQDERFIEASLAEQEALQAAEEARRQRELTAAQTLAEEQRRRAEAEAQRAEAQAESAGKLRRRAILLAVAMGALAVLLLAAIGLGTMANRSAREAQELTRLATSRELAAAAVNNLQLDPERSVLLALEALQTADTLQARNALHQALPELHILRTIPAHSGGVPGVAVSPDGERLATTGVDNTLKIWDAASGELLLRLPVDAGETGIDVAYSPDGTRLATVWLSQVVLLDAESGERLFALPGETAGTVRRLDFSPDGGRLAVASMDGLPRVWDLATQSELFSLAGHDQFCEAIAYSPDGSRLATGDAEGIIKLWDAGSGEELLSFEHGGGIHSVAFSPDGTQLAVASDNARLGIWNTASGEPLLNLPLQSGVYDVAYFPDGKQLAATHQNGTVTIWDPFTGRLILLLAGHTSTVISAAVSPDNKLLVTGGYDGTLKLWDTNPGRELLTIAAHDDQVYDVAFSPDDLGLITAGFDGKARLWDPVSGLLVRSLPPENPSSGLSSLALTQNGNLMALGSWDGTVYVVNMDTGREEKTLLEHMAPVPDLAFSADGKQLATASWDGSANVWDVDTGEPIFTVFSKDDLGVSMAISGLAFSPDSSQLFSGGDDDFVHQWDIRTGQELESFDGGGLDIYGVAVSPNGRLLAAGRQDGAILLWDISSGELLQQLAAHAGLILRLAFSSDGTKLASVGFDSLAKVWDVESGQELMTLYGGTGNLFGAAFSADDHHLATAVGDGTVRLYTLSLEELISVAQARVTRELTAEECRIYLHSDECPTT